jgi:plastocyanin
MRTTVTALAVWLSLAGPASVAATGELRGLVRAGNHPVADAVVWLEAPPGAMAESGPAPLLDQRNLQFLPRVLAVRVGTRVKFPNSDRVFHNVFSFHDGKQFDLGVYPVGAVKYVTFDLPGVSRLFCNIHPGMAGYVVVVDSPYFSAAGEAGAFTIHAPPGRYTYRAWRPSAELLTGQVTVETNGSLEVRWP